MTKATGLWALGEHGTRILFALSVHRPISTALILILADVFANSAGCGAHLVHHAWVLEALVIERPHRAGRHIVVRAPILARSRCTARCTGFERVSRIAEAFASGCPARAIIMSVFALSLAYSTRDWAINVHEAGILTALAFLGPMVAVRVDVRAQGGAQPARCWAILAHVVRGRFALTTLGPPWARLLKVRADDGAHAAAVRTE